MRTETLDKIRIALVLTVAVLSYLTGSWWALALIPAAFYLGVVACMLATREERQRQMARHWKPNF